MKKLVFTAPAAISGVRTLADGTVKLDVLIAKELPAAEMTMLFEARKLGNGWFLFSPNDLEDAEVPEERADTHFEGKSPSKRLYNVMYVTWKECTNMSTSFDVWRTEQLEKIINGYKSKLPEIK